MLELLVELAVLVGLVGLVDDVELVVDDDEPVGPLLVVDVELVVVDEELVALVGSTNRRPKMPPRSPSWSSET